MPLFKFIVGIAIKVNPNLGDLIMFKSFEFKSIIRFLGIIVLLFLSNAQPLKSADSFEKLPCEIIGQQIAPHLTEMQLGIFAQVCTSFRICAEISRKTRTIEIGTSKLMDDT